MALDTTGLQPLDTSGLTPASDTDAGFDTSGLTPLDTSGLTAIGSTTAPAKEDSWGAIGRKLLENAPTMFRQAGGGLAQMLAEVEPQPPATAGIMPGDPMWEEQVARPHRERVAAMREAGTLPGQKLYEEATEELQENAPQVDPESLKGYAYDISQGIIQMVPSVAATLATRQPAVGATIIGGQVAGPRYGESREAGRTPEQATADAAFYAAAEGIPEMIPLGILMKPGKAFLSRTLKTAGAEGIQEMFTEALQTGYDVGVLDEEMTWGEAVSNIRRAGIVGTGVGAGMAVGTQPFVRRGEQTADEVPEGAVPAETLFGEEAQPEGIREQSVSQTPPPTPEDDASPIPTDLIQQGRESLQDATGAVSASRILEEAGFPAVNSQITLSTRDGGRISGTVIDAFDADGRQGAKIRFDDGRVVSETFDELRGRVSPTVLQEAQDEQADSRQRSQEEWEQAWRDQGMVDPSADLPDTTIDIEGRPAAPEAAAEEVAEPETTASVPVMITQRMRQQLSELGYTPDDVRTMQPQGAWDLINEGRRKTEPEAAPEPVAEVQPFTPEVALETALEAAPAQEQPQAEPEQARQPVARRDVEKGEDTAVTASGREVPVRYAVVEAADLQASQLDDGRVNPDYPADLQPRDRSRGVSQQQIQDIAQNLNPRLVERSPRAGDGAPIVADDGVVESGNGRILAIRRAYAEGLETSQQYRDYLAEQGYPVEGLNQPVLVRVREGGMEASDRQAFTREANERDTLGMSATERAMADATALPDSLLELYRGGEVDTAANRPFVRAFLERVVGRNEQAGMIAADGAMSQEAMRRVEGALLAKAYGDADLVANLIESADTNIRAIGGALMDVAPAWAQMRADVAAGVLDPSMEQTARLLEAVRLVQRARRENRSVAEFVTQTDMLSGDALHPVAELYLRLMFRNTQNWTQPVGREKLADALRLYLSEAERAQPGADLLGDTPSSERILETAKERKYGREQETDQQDLLAQPARRPGERDGQGGRERAEQPQQGAEAPRGEEGPRAREETAPAESVAPTTEAPLRVEDYTDKSVIVRGETQENVERIKDAGKAAGVRALWNKKAKGWVFPKTREAQVREALADLLEAPTVTQATEASPSVTLEESQETADDGIQGPVPPSDAPAGAEDVQPAAPDRSDGRAPAAEDGRGAPPVQRPDRERAEAAERPAERPVGEGGRGAGVRDTDRVPAGRGERAERPAESAQRIKGDNYRIEPGSLEETRGRVQKARDNIRAIELMRQIEAEGRPATRAEQEQLARYVGWGGLKGAFPDSQGKFEKGLETVGKQLQELLTETEYATARRSLQYAHYTAENVARTMWDAAQRLGFTGGKVFEPGMGVGNFPGLMPADMAAATDYHGLELDHTTSRIARLLYPQWGVRQDDFTRAPLPKDTYDLVIGNPPFADIPIRSDPAYPQGFLLHDYFFAKSLDAVRPGGMLAFISSAGTMNKMDASAREYLADRADLVAAIRLPGNAFEQSAGTSVTTDILFLRKRLPGESAGDRSWTETVEVTLPNKDGTPTRGRVSRHFVDNPEMVLGEEGFFDPLYEGRYGVRAPKGFDLDAALRQALGRLPENVMSEWADTTDRAEIDFGTAERKEGSFYLGRDGQLMQQREGVGRPVQRRGKGVEGGRSLAEMERIQALVPVRDALRAVYAADLAGDSANAGKARERLNKSYDAFVERFGPVNKAEFQYRRPTIIQQESARAEAREEARFTGTPWREGDFDAAAMIEQGATLQQIARARQEAREKAQKAGKPFDEGSFDPTDIPDLVIEKRPNVDPFMDDPESYRIRAIEKYNDQSGEAAKSAVFFENVITRERAPEINSVNDAVLYVLNQKGRLDITEVARSAGVSESEAIEQLGDGIYRLPGTDGQWVTRDEYLSGNVRRKLRQARAAAERDPSLQRNVDALEAAQPAPLPPSEINANLGMPWIPTEAIQQFGTEALGLNNLSVRYTPVLGLWEVSGDSDSAAAVSTWGTDDRSAPALISDALNRQDPRIYREIRVDGQKRRELDAVATEAAQEKVREIKQRFADWVWSDPARARELAELYNEEYNNLVVREYDGEYLTTPGISSAWSWRPHQTRVIARIIQSGNTYMAHSVGAGKTSAMIGAGMEMRRLGLVRKPMYVVPNHMLGQFTKEFYEQYPTARIAVADERRFHTGRRKQFIADVANEDLDAVIITHSAFGMVPISDEFQDAMIQEQIDQYRAILSDVGKDQESRITRSRLEKQIERLEQRLSGRAHKKRDQVFTFEEMGTDFLFVDEAHLFRKLDFATKMSNVKGISPEGSKASWDLFVKTRFLETVNPGRNLVMASGTPVTNTMAELYTVSRYLQPAELRDRSLEHFDAWAGAYGDTVTNLEQDPAGGYKPVTRFAKFVNVPELSNMVRQNMDVVTSRQLEQYVTRPALKDGKRQMNLAEKSEALDAYQTELASRMEAIANRRGPPQPGDDIILNVINDGRHAAIDMRLVDPELPNDPGSKLNLLVDNVFRIWQDTKRQPFHTPAQDGYSAKPVDKGPSAQMVFANLGLSGKRGFSVPDYIRAELQRRGVPKNQIAYIADYKTHVARQRLFNDINEGKVRVLIGSTAKMATGVNAQRRLFALHNLDPLWYPADDEQRNGRILRQGNMNPEIVIHDYSTKGTYDSTMWGMMETKARFIQGFFEGDPNLRDMEDLGEASQYEQAKAITTADPRLIELTELRQQLERAQRRKAAHEREQYSLEQRVATARDRKRHYTGRISAIEADIGRRQDIGGDSFRAKVDGKTYADRVEVGDLLLARLDTLKGEAREVRGEKVGEIGGFDILAEVWGSKDNRVAALAIGREGGYETEVRVSGSAKGLVQSLEGVLRGFEGDLSDARQRLQKAETDIAQFQPQVGKAFTGQQEIDRITEQVRTLERELAPKKEEKAPASEGDTEGQFALRDNAAAQAWLEIARNDEVFSYPRSEAKDFESIMAEVAPDMRVVRETDIPSDVPQAWRIHPPSGNGYGYVIEYDNGTVQVSMGNFKENEGGSAIYAAAGTYAHNSGLKFAEDKYRAGPKGRQRRIENLISLALKFRSTDFIDPFGKKAKQWVEGDTARNLQYMLEESYGNARKLFRDIGAYEFDPATGGISLAPGGERLLGGDQRGREAGDTGDRARTRPFLGRTLRRAIITKWIVERSRGDAEGAAQILSRVGANGDLLRVLYSARGGESAPGFTEGFARDADALTTDLADRLKKLGIADKVALNLRDRIQAVVDGKASEADGRYLNRVIEVSLESRDGMRALNHEVIHALRDLGLIRDAEWRPLTRAARADSDLMADVERRYGHMELTEDLLVEEAIAEMFADWSAGRSQAGGFMRRAFERIRDFLQALGQALTGRGFTTADSVFRSIERGEVGSRRPRDAQGRFEKFALADPKVMDPTAKGGAQARQKAANQWYGTQPLDQAFRLPWHIFGGINEHGEWKLGLRLSKKTGDIITNAKFSAEGRFSWINPALERARAGLLDRYGLDPAYVERERQRGLDQRRIMAQVPEIMERLKEAQIGTAESKVLQSVLTGEAVADAEMAKISEPIRNAIDDMGAEAVQLGLVSAEAFERNRGAYLHRVYLKHEADQGGLSRWVSRVTSRRRRSIIGNQFKGRGLWIEVDKARMMRRVPGYAEAERGEPTKGERFRVLDLVEGADQETLRGIDPKSTRKVLNRVYLPADAKVPDGLSGYVDRGLWEVRGTKQGNLVLWRDFTKPERTSMGEIVDARYTIAKTYMQMAHDLSTGRFFRDLALNEDWSRASEPRTGTWSDAQEYNRFWADPSIDWVKVPDTTIPKSQTKRYGQLAGRYVRAEIWRDLHELEQMQKANWWNNLLTSWKLMKTARSPVVHMNNIMSNVALMDMADVRMVDLARGIRAMIREDAEYREAVDNGAFGSDMVAQEIRKNTLQPLLEEVQRDVQGGRDSMQATFGLVGKLADTIWRGGKNLDRKMVNLYQLEDEVFRMATYLRKRSLGFSPTDAALQARDQFLNYDIRAPWVNAARRSLLPFISYTYRAVPVVAHSVMLRPWKLAKYATIAYAANALAYMLDDGDEEEERRSLRDTETGYTWIGAPRMIRMPWSDDYGNPVFLDVRRWIPAGDVFDMNQGHGAFAIPAPLQFGGPLMLGAELMLNKQAFTGKEITNDRTDDWWGKTRKVGDWGWKAWMPSAAWIPGSWYWEKIGNAVTGARDRQGRPYSVPSALSSSVGVKLKPQDVEEAFFWKGIEFDRVERELKAELRSLHRDHDRGMLSRDALERRERGVIRKLDRLGQERERTFTPQR